MSQKHTVKRELLALREEAQTAFEHHAVDVLAKLYGLVSALNLQRRIDGEVEFERSSKTVSSG